MSARISVIVPVKDDERVFRCVESVLASARDVAEAEVLVVDNASASAFSASLRALEADGVRLLCEERPGAFAARNAAVRVAAGDLLFFTDADCEVDRGWVAEGLAALDRFGADVVLGFSDGAGDGATHRLIQARYAKRLQRLPAGEPTELDTRNLAARRAVLERVPFNDRYRRTGDTELGLLAELQGFRVAYAPGMRVSHVHDDSLAMFVAKQLCHGWGAQRITRETPGVAWHGGHLRAVARVSRAFGAVPGRRVLAQGLGAAAVAGGRGLDRAGSDRLPYGASLALLTALDKAASLAGHLLYEAGGAEPLVSEVLGRPVPRD